MRRQHTPHENGQTVSRQNNRLQQQNTSTPAPQQSTNNRFPHHIHITNDIPFDPNLPYGDEIEYTKKPPNTLRIYYQNIRGAKISQHTRNDKTKDPWDSWEKGYAILKDWDVDVAALVETNTSWTFNNIRAA
jgi:hypothetical protein